MTCPCRQVSEQIFNIESYPLVQTQCKTPNQILDIILDTNNPQNKKKWVKIMLNDHKIKNKFLSHKFFKLIKLGFLKQFWLELRSRWDRVYRPSMPSGRLFGFLDRLSIHQIYFCRRIVDLLVMDMTLSRHSHYRCCYMHLHHRHQSMEVQCCWCWLRRSLWGI